MTTPAAPLLVADAPLAHLRWHGPAASGAPPWLLLHGIGGGRHAWDAVAPALAAAGHTVVAVDFPGYGLSPAITPFDLAGLAGRVHQLVLHLCAGRGQAAAVLVGHSMGGMVAQEVAARWPEAVAGLVLANTSAAFGKPGGDWQQGFLRSRFAPLDAGLGMAGLAAQLVPTMVAPGLPPERLAQAQALMAGVPKATYRAAVMALLPFDRRAALANITVPTLVVTGEHDRTAPLDVARRLADRIAGAVWAVVPHAGHLLPMEQPEALVAAVLQALPPR